MSLTRRRWLQGMACAAGSALLWRVREVDAAASAPFAISKRPPAAQRKFVSPAVEAEIARVKAKIGDPELAWMFENCYPNTLDTAVTLGTLQGREDTFIVTGDIDAMWMRDSAAQVWPYLSLAKRDASLQRLYRGLIRRHALCITIDPYANAFMPDPTMHSNLSWAQHDDTDMRPGVAERKWEIDSLCYPIRLAYAYWRATGDQQPFDAQWWQAMQRVVDTWREQQRKQGQGPYRFQRAAANPTDTLGLDGYGAPAKPVGLIYAGFRPSDDACTYPFFVPGNLFAVRTLRWLAEMSVALRHDQGFARQCQTLAQEVEQALKRYAVIRDRPGGDIWAYEVDGYGNQLFMDDANAPSLSSLAYLGCVDARDALYLRTRERAWSEANPYFFRGSAAEGIGGPHEGLRMIWPMSIIMRALTTDDEADIRRCLHWLKTTHAGSGFMHETFDQDNPAHFTRSWFAWANSLFGELIVKLADQHSDVLRRS